MQSEGSRLDRDKEVMMALRAVVIGAGWAGEGHTLGPARPRASALYRNLTLGFAFGVAIQVFLAGAGIFVEPAWLGAHSAFAVLLLLVAVVLLILSYVARCARPIIGLNALLVVLIMVQSFLIHGGQSLGLPLLQALHPVNALAIFMLPLYLWLRTAPTKSRSHKKANRSDT
jgi:hypothetical protein